MRPSPRLQVLSTTLPKLRVDALLITHLPNIRYLCGFTGSAGILLLGGANPVFFTDGRYTEQAQEEVRGARVQIEKKSPLAVAAELLARKRASSHLGIEADHLTVATQERLRSLLPNPWRLRSLSGTVERQRIVKDAGEIELLRLAVNLGSSLFSPLLKTIRPGIPETTVAAKLEYSARHAGAAGMSFDSIIAAGPRSALPHGRASATPIPRRGLVVLDFGVILAGYCSDMTRTVGLDRASARAAAKERIWYNAVLEAQLAGIAAARPGVTAGQVDDACRKVLKKHKLAQYFTHSTGHGVGLEIHEPPRLAAGETTVLEPGMVLTIEPGVYIPGQGGVRIEDMILVTEAGCEVLTPTTKDFITLA